MSKQKIPNWKVKLSKLLLITLISTSLAVPGSTEAVVVEQSQLPGPVLVQETSAELSAQGCLARTLEDPSGPIDVPPGKPYPVLGRDFSPQTVHLCSPEVRQNLTVIEGEVEGLLLFGGLAALGLAAGTAATPAGRAATKFVLDKVGRAALIAYLLLIATLAGLANWLFGFAIAFLEFSLTAPSGFITNPMVTQVWPFIQGLANLGFMIALLFIAFATTLQLKQDFTAKRMLPRLLIAALLINFSLVIAGVLIDLTQVTMAVLFRILIDEPFGALGDQLTKTSGALEMAAEVKDKGREAVNEAKGTLLDLAISLTLKFLTLATLTLAFLTLGIILLVRYVILLVLLILSPIPYLAIAFPNGKSVASKWWGEFVKYALFGPIALFFIILAIKVEELVGGATIDSGGRGIDNVVQTVLIAIIAISAVFVTRKLAGSFSLSVVDFAGAKTKQAGKALGRGAGRGARVASKGARKAASTATKPARQSARDFVQKTGEGLRDAAKAKGIPVPAKRDKDGKLKPGEQSAGSQLGDVVKGKLSPKVQQKVAMGNAIRAEANNRDADEQGRLWNPNVVNSLNLRDGETAKAAGKQAINRIVVNTPDKGMVNGVVHNDDYLRSLDDSDKLDLMNAINDNGNLTEPEKEKTIEALMKQIKKLDKG